MPMIKLQSSDGEVFQVDFEVAKASVTIKNMIEDLGMEDEEKIIPLPKVNAKILNKIIQWATHHKDDFLSTKDEERKKCTIITSWDADFLKMDQETLFELVTAANYLDIEGLVHVTCKTIAGMIQGTTAEEVRRTFNITNDLTPAEEEQIRRENEWCEEK